MSNSERGSAKRLLDHVARDLDLGRTPEELFASAALYCDRLPLPDRMAPALLLAWLTAGHAQHRPLGQMVADAQLLHQILKPDRGGNPAAPEAARSLGGTQ